MPELHKALYRVWRPQRLTDVVGQTHITRTLKNALKRQKVAHAYLFSGPRGTGKTSIARIVAKALNCLQPDGIEPCNQCARCLSINDGSMLDVLEMDAASNRGIDEIRQLREKVRYASTEADYKVYIIDEAHMLTTEAFNALLKVIEDPPTKVVFILATTEVHKIPLTVASRCQSFSFGPISEQEIVTRLEQITSELKVTATPAALLAVARAAEGGLRDAISILEQSILSSEDKLGTEEVASVIGSVPREIAEQLLEAVIAGELKNIIDLLEMHVAINGVDACLLLQELVFTCRDALIMNITETEQSTTTESRKKLVIVLDKLVSCQSDMRQTVHPSIMLEAVLCNLAAGPVPSAAPHGAALRGGGSAQPTCNCDRLEKRIIALEAMLDKAVASIDKNASAKSVTIPTAKARADVRTAPRIHTKRTKIENCPEKLRIAQETWPQILAAVKKAKITVHAWLVAGEVVAANDKQLCIAYKSKIHCDTIMKSANREVVEKFIADLLPGMQHIVSVMWDDWQATNHSVQVKEPPQGDIVEQAIELFGADLVEIDKSEERLK